MLLLATLFSFLSAGSALSIDGFHPQHLFANPPEHDEGYRIPTIHESAVMARRILHLFTLGTLVTSFPDAQPSSDKVDTSENRPPGIDNNPIGLMEYYADCEANGNPTLLAINIATPYKNYIAGSNISLGVRWWPKQSTTYSLFSNDDDEEEEEIPTPHTPAALPRFSLHGYLEPIPNSDLLAKLIPACFLKTHPDSILWQPGNHISHESEYMRFVVEYVYWFGGFGDRARIGWLPIEEYRNVSMEEVAECRLPGEEKKKKSKGWWRDWL